MPEKMAPITDPEFNLWDEPWILVLDHNREMQEVSLTEVLLNAHQYERLAGELPTQDAALLRLLLAILHTVFSRVNIDGDHDPLTEENALDRWEEIWKEGRIPEKPILMYRDEWHERFWLFHPERPFYQVPEAKNGTEYGAAKLNGVISESNNKKRLFPSRQGKDKETLSFSEASRWLIYAYSFWDAASVKKRTGTGLGWLGRIGLFFSEGKNLFETLLYNLVLYSDENDERWYICQPIWEEDELRSCLGKKGTQIPIPTNPASMLTIQTKRILLTKQEKRVVGGYIMGGDFCDTKDCFTEKMTVWRRIQNKNETPYFVPRLHDPEIQIWREFSSLLQKDESSHIPGIIQWHIELFENGILDGRFINYVITSAKYDDKNASIVESFSDA